MGWFQRTFLNTPQARIERAEHYLQLQEYNQARLELSTLQTQKAQELLDIALSGLIELNLGEAEARFSAGDYQGASEHIQMAEQFGATPSQISTVRKKGLEFKRQKQIEEQKQREQKKKSPASLGNDPIYSLPPNHPKLRFTLYLEGYPVLLRERLIPLGQEFLEAVLSIEDGNPKHAYHLLTNCVEREPTARFERARAALALKEYPSAISDLMMFGEEVGHHEINQTHSGALLSQLLLQVGRSTESLSEVDSLLTQDQHPSLRIVRSQILEASGHLNEAEQSTQTIVKEFPKSLPLIRQLARIRIKLGKRILAASTLEEGLKSCCTPGSCSSQPMDIASVRMLAQIYLEDNVLPKRSTELLKILNTQARTRVWEDHYIALLHNRNIGSPYVANSAQHLLNQLKENDHRRAWVKKAFQIA